MKEIEHREISQIYRDLINNYPIKFGLGPLHVFWVFYSPWETSRIIPRVRPILIHLPQNLKTKFCRLIFHNLFLEIAENFINNHNWNITRLRAVALSFS